MSDDDHKRSWRELDQARDRGIKISKSVSKKEERENKTATHQAKQQLEKLFSNSPLSKEKLSKVQEIQSLRGKPGYYDKMTSYISEYGIPLEWDAQLLFIDHRDSNIVVQVLDQLKRTAPRESITKQDVLVQKLKVLALSTFDSKLLDKIKELQQSLVRG